MTSSEIREKFLRYFEKQGHKRVRSSPLIPAQDPTLLFTNAGMVPFKDYFTGLKKPPYTRATSSQKCLRVSGKHNDLENVGRTARHHTFFEMLGNFSFGDYFKEEAIRFGWEFLTKEMGLPKERLWITIFEKDDEAERLWQKVAGVPKDRIKRFGEKDNFWAMGETGPCGPCSEIHYDHGKELSCGKPTCGVGCDCDRVMEVWNLVFMQFERDASGAMKPLPKPSIDTGMGLERLAAIVQGKCSNYESDLFLPLIHEIERISGRRYGQDEEINISIRVIADHIRATTFLIADGVHPSNEGRGYVLRRIMRRAIRHGRLLGRTEPFFYQFVEKLVSEMGGAYPELKKEKEGIEKVIRAEEEKFLETLDRGLSILEEEFSSAKGRGRSILPGEVVFRLYDTYGFPVDLTDVIARERGFALEMTEFEHLMEGQRERGKKAWKGTVKKDLFQGILSEVRSDFDGYERLEGRAPVVALVKGEKRVSKASTGDEVFMVTLKTPFYPEGGGQVGDQGEVSSKNLKGEVIDTQKGGDALILHKVRLEEGSLAEGDEVELRVDRKFREGAMHHHSATHLLHAALREVLGTHVRQAGSLVEPGRLRFDFNHFEQVPRATLRTIEELVNQKIRERLKVTHEVLPFEEAMKKGALAFFGEKYGDEVRVVKMGPFSLELCGGTHVQNSSEIKLFKFTHEGSVAAGVRRVEAVVGESALKKLQELEDQMTQIATSLKVSPGQVADRIERLLDQVKTLEKELKTQKRQGAASEASDERIKEVNGVKVLILRTDLGDTESLRNLSDQKINNLQSGILLLGGGSGEKLSLILRVSKDLTSRYKAGELLKKIASAVGGSGGGRAEMAQGAAPAAKWEEAIARLLRLTSE